MNIAVILSGGIGSRMGSNIPKQYIMVAGRPIISYCIDKFVQSKEIDTLVIALDKRWIDFIQPYVATLQLPVYYAEPGETRQHTIYNTLKLIRSHGGVDDDVVIIHDSVRPLVSSQVIHDCICGCIANDAAIATISVKDTIYMSTEEDCITDVPKRSTLHAGQTPEAFKLGKYLKIHEERSYEEIAAVTGGAEFAFRCGMKVFLSKGEEINFKLTTPEDLERFEQIVNSNQL